MEDPQYILMAVEPLPKGDWLAQIQELISSAGFNIMRRRSELLVWQQQRQSNHVCYSDGWSIGRIWLAPRRWALGVTSRRLYFVGKSMQIEERPEYEVVSGVRPPSPLASEQLESQWSLVQTLQQGLRSAAHVSLQLVNPNLGKYREVYIGTNKYVSPPNRLNALYREHGFDVVPNDFSLVVCPLESVAENDANEFARRLEKVSSQRNTRTKVRIVSPGQIKKRLLHLKATGGQVAEGHCILFILPSSRQIPRAETMSLFESLATKGVPYRRAYADDPLDYSIPDQLPSLLIAAGGRPHRSPTNLDRMPVWTVGVDLGHRTDRSVSILALTLVDPDGGLVGAWTKEQPLDETAHAESVSNLLVQCRHRLASCDGSARVIVLRDGRMFENEDGNLYRATLNTDVSFFEYRKRGNPQITLLAQTDLSIRNPLAATVPGASTMFIMTAPPRDECTLPAVAKVTWRPEWNGLNLQPSEVSSVLAASAAAPGLGLHPRHLPAAIYWADGIAGASGLDLRFMGVPVNQ